MADFFQVHVRCALCAAASLRSRVRGVSGSGSPDLDLRPPEPARSFLAFRVEHCDACGYCWRRLGEAPAGAAEAVASFIYRDVLDEARMPLLARRLFCATLVAEGSGLRERAAWGYLEAAWACDDAYAPVQARTCRERAADAFLAALEWGEAGALPSSVRTLVADILRRAGRFEDALASLDAAETHAMPETEDDPEAAVAGAAVRRFMRALCELEDAAAHPLAEAFAVEE